MGRGSRLAGGLDGRPTPDAAYVKRRELPIWRVLPAGQEEEGAGRGKEEGCGGGMSACVGRFAEPLFPGKPMLAVAVRSIYKVTAPIAGACARAGACCTGIIVGGRACNRPAPSICQGSALASRPPANSLESRGTPCTSGIQFRQLPCTDEFRGRCCACLSWSSTTSVPRSTVANTLLSNRRMLARHATNYPGSQTGDMSKMLRCITSGNVGIDRLGLTTQRHYVAPRPGPRR